MQRSYSRLRGPIITVCNAGHMHLQSFHCSNLVKSKEVPNLIQDQSKRSGGCIGNALAHVETRVPGKSGTFQIIDKNKLHTWQYILGFGIHGTSIANFLIDFLVELKITIFPNHGCNIENFVFKQ